jgi:hypothetical protein
MGYRKYWEKQQGKVENETESPFQHQKLLSKFLCYDGLLSNATVNAVCKSLQFFERTLIFKILKPDIFRSLNTTFKEFL